MCLWPQILVVLSQTLTSMNPHSFVFLKWRFHDASKISGQLQHWIKVTLSFKIHRLSSEAGESVWWVVSLCFWNRKWTLVAWRFEPLLDWNNHNCKWCLHCFRRGVWLHSCVGLTFVMMFWQKKHSFSESSFRLDVHFITWSLKSVLFSLFSTWRLHLGCFCAYLFTHSCRCIPSDSGYDVQSGHGLLGAD